MTIELVELKSNDLNFQKLDYLYLHNKSGYPLSSEMNLENFFFIVEVFENKITLIGLVTGQQKELDFSDLSGYWWILRIPEVIRMKLL